MLLSRAIYNSSPHLFLKSAIQPCYSTLGTPKQHLINEILATHVKEKVPTEMIRSWVGGG